jgi:glycerol-3-phosphate dehydrogenase (NAD(P)+)
MSAALGDRAPRAAIGIAGDATLCAVIAHRAVAAAAATQRKPLVLLHCPDDPSRDDPARDTSPPDPAQDLPAGVTRAPDLAALGARCHLIVLAVSPSQARAQVRALGAALDGSHLLLHAVRGFEPGRHIPISAVIREETCVRKVGALVGPSLLLQDATRPGAAVVASRFAEVIGAAQQALSSPMFRVYGNADLEGVEVSSVLISALSVAMGLCAEMTLGPAVESLLLTRGLAEITRLVKALGGQPQTPFGLSGLGDLIVQRDVNSPEVRLGRLLLRAGSLEAARAQVGALADEVAASLQAIVAAGARKGVAAHIIPTVHDLLNGTCDPPEAMRRLMSLQQMIE